MSTYASLCQGSEYVSEEELISLPLSRIANRDRLLKLSTLCGRTFKYHNVRHRLSYVHDEVRGRFVATRDYTPWDEVELSFSEIQELFPEVNKRLEQPLTGEEDVLNAQAVTLQLLRENWDRIYRIEHYQKQHMFYSKYNEWEQRIDIEIHQSKHTFPYHYKHPRELVATTRTIVI